MAKKLPIHVKNFHAAIEKAGSQVAFAKICGCTTGNIWQLVANSSPLPAKYALKVEAADLGFDRHDLCPEVFGPPLIATQSPKGQAA